MLWQFGEMGYDISIDENGRTGKKPVLWEYQTERKSLVDIYTKLITLRTTHSDLFNASSQFTWKVSYNDWDNGRTLTLKAVNGNFMCMRISPMHLSIILFLKVHGIYIWKMGIPWREKKRSVFLHTSSAYTPTLPNNERVF